MTTQAPRNDVGPDDAIVWEPASPADEQPAEKRLIWVLIAAVVGGLIVIAGILYVAGYVVTGDKVPRKAQISGVAVGGLSSLEAIQKLSVELGARAAEPLNLTVGEARGTSSNRLMPVFLSTTRRALMRPAAARA